MGEPTDAKALIRDLNAALPLQYRCTLEFALAAGSLEGPQGIALAPHLRAIAAEELRDTERIAGRVSALGGKPSSTVGRLHAPSEWRPATEALVALLRESLDAVVKAIPADADDAEGEATEHLLEHVVARKRDALELLERALR